MALTLFPESGEAVEHFYCLRTAENNTRCILGDPTMKHYKVYINGTVRSRSGSRNALSRIKPGRTYQRREARNEIARPIEAIAHPYD